MVWEAAKAPLIKSMSPDLEDSPVPSAAVSAAQKERGRGGFFFGDRW
jgi:hypothetical protein